MRISLLFFSDGQLLMLVGNSYRASPCTAQRRALLIMASVRLSVSHVVVLCLNEYESRQTFSDR